MAYHFTRSRARSELEGSDIEPSDVAPVAATSSSSPSSIIVRQSIAAAGGPESMSTESAGPMSAPTHPLPAGSPPSSGVLGVSGPAGPPQVGVSSLGYPSGLAGPSEVSEHSREQSSSSIATVVDVFVASCCLLPASRQQTAAATETAAAEGLTLVIDCCSWYNCTKEVTVKCMRILF